MEKPKFTVGDIIFGSTTGFGNAMDGKKERGDPILIRIERAFCFGDEWYYAGKNIQQVIKEEDVTKM